MPRLVVCPNSPQAWEIQLKPGENLLGRGFANDFKFDDPSVSGSHCSIVIGDGVAMIRDFGSTNGTFVGGSQVQQANLQNAQPIRLGNVEMIFYTDVAAAPVPAMQIPPPPPKPAFTARAVAPVPASNDEEVIIIPSAPSRPPALRLSATEHAPAPPTHTPPAPPPLSASTASIRVAPPMPPPVRATAPAGGAATGARFCKFHPKNPARYLCTKCNRSFCDLCVTSFNVGGEVKKKCRSCGVECEPLEVTWTPGAGTKGFFARIPGAFIYPFRGGGIFVMIVGLIIFIGLKLGTILMHAGGIRSIIMGITLEISAGGYLFTYLQNILFATANEERELPDLPGVDNFLEDVLLPFFRLVGLAIVCFGPAIGLAFLAPQITILPAAIAQLIGYLYFPMAFLAVAMLDSVVAANPLLVIRSMFRAPLEYLFSLIFLFFVTFVYFGGMFAIGKIFYEGFETRSMGMLFGMIGSYVFMSLVGLYLLLVAIHILGLIFATKKDKLGWLDSE
jgi:hypothetical protein